MDQFHAHSKSKKDIAGSALREDHLRKSDCTVEFYTRTEPIERQGKYHPYSELEKTMVVIEIKKFKIVRRGPLLEETI